MRSRIPRAIGTAGAALFAALATAFAIRLYSLLSSISGLSLILWVVAGTLAVPICWLGVWAWWRGRWGLAALGMWVSSAMNLWLFNLILVPIALAVVASVLAMKDWRQHGRRTSPKNPNIAQFIFLCLAFSVLTTTPAQATHDVVCEGVAPAEKYCSREFIAAEDIVGSGWANGLESGGFVATVVGERGYREFIACLRFVGFNRGHGHCEVMSFGPLPKSGEVVKLEVRAQGQGFWKVTLLYPPHDDPL